MPSHNAKEVEEMRMRKFDECPDCQIRLVGAEIKDEYDGVSYYFCPSCHRKWDRWTGFEIVDLARHVFKRFSR